MATNKEIEGLQDVVEDWIRQLSYAARIAVELVRKEGVYAGLEIKSALARFENKIETLNLAPLESDAAMVGLAQSVRKNNELLQSMLTELKLKQAPRKKAWWHFS
jgi:hypothetical protein